MRANNIRRQMLSEKNALYQQRRILFMSIEGTALNPVRLVAAALIGLVIDLAYQRNLGGTDKFTGTALHAIHYVHVFHTLPVLLIRKFCKIQR